MLLVYFIGQKYKNKAYKYSQIGCSGTLTRPIICGMIPGDLLRSERAAVSFLPDLILFRSLTVWVSNFDAM